MLLHPSWSHAQEPSVSRASSLAPATLKQDVFNHWRVISGRVLGLGQWQDIVLKHRTEPYWIHAKLARLGSRPGSLELGPKVRVFLPYSYSIDAAQASLGPNTVRVESPAVWSTPLGRINAGTTTLDLSSPLRVTVHHLGARRHVSLSLVSSD